MAIFYFDTSAIVKRYHRELGSDVVDKIFESKEHGFTISFWTVLEFMVAFSAKRKRKALSEEAFRVTMARFLKDVLDKFMIRSVSDELVASAISIANKYALPSADCLQLTSALESKKILDEVKQKVVLVASDEEMNKVAKKEGLELINPEEDNALDKLSKIISQP
ncbi:MAG: type II toxin-antitoxin system VapC family toxin [archaeon]|nr:type II toxin-antitoxin system VapC family toxin [archaeon]